MARRQKISTTVAPETYAYLKRLVKSGRARNVAEALDQSLARLRREERRARLESATATYFDGLPPQTAEVEASLETALDQSADEINVDG
jgi:hypothetical protein